MVDARILVLFLLSCVKIVAQTDTVRFYFAIDEFDPAIHRARLDSLAKGLQAGEHGIKILGFADYLHSPGYNISLSQKRADGIREQLLLRAPNARVDECRGFGEQFSKAQEQRQGEAFQRRVDVLVSRPAAVKTIKPEKAADTLKPARAEEQVIEGLSGMMKGEKLAIEGLNFEPGRHFITKASVPVLQKLLYTLQQNPKLKIQIQGHVCCTDGPGDGYDHDTHDRKLSENRARAIHDYLVNKGISKHRLSYKGFGHSQPKFPLERTPEEEQANRRVEIMVVDK